MGNIRDEDKPPSHEGEERVRGNSRYRFTNGQWVFIGSVIDQSNNSQPNVPGGKYGGVIPNTAEPVIETAAGPVAAGSDAGEYGTAYYGEDATGRVIRYVWNGATGQYEPDPQHQSSSDLAAAMNGAGLFFKREPGHTYAWANDGTLRGTGPTSIVPNPVPTEAATPDLTGQRVGTGQGTRVADAAQVVAGTSVVSGVGDPSAQYRMVVDPLRGTFKGWQMNTNGVWSVSPPPPSGTSYVSFNGSVSGPKSVYNAPATPTTSIVANGPPRYKPLPRVGGNSIVSRFIPKKPVLTGGARTVMQ